MIKELLDSSMKKQELKGKIKCANFLSSLDFNGWTQGNRRMMLESRSKFPFSARGREKPANASSVGLPPALSSKSSRPSKRYLHASKPPLKRVWARVVPVKFNLFKKNIPSSHAGTKIILVKFPRPCDKGRLPLAKNWLAH